MSLVNVLNKTKERLADGHVPWKQMYIYSLSFFNHMETSTRISVRGLDCI